MSSSTNHRLQRSPAARRPVRHHILAAALAFTALAAAACDTHTPTGTGSLFTLTVTPDATLPVNGVLQFTAVGTDADGRTVAVSPTWSVDSGGGTISSGGMFTAGTVPGVYVATVQATSGGRSGTANVTVVVGALASIVVTPGPRSVAEGATQLFTAVGRDGSGNVVTITPAWSVVAGGGTINASSGLFTAGNVIGTFTSTVRATSGTTFGSATVHVVAPSVIPLGAVETHGMLAGSGFSCVSLGVIDSDASVWPGSAFTGFPPCVITGATHAADAQAQAAQADLTTAYDQLSLLPCDATLVADLGGQTLQPGVYCSLSSQGLTGEMFLDALGDPNAIFVIRAASTLTTAMAEVTLLNGAAARNVYWVAGSSVTMGVGSAMKGNVLALSSITLIDNATLLGRALARNGAVTLNNNNVITLP